MMLASTTVEMMDVDKENTDAVAVHHAAGKDGGVKPKRKAMETKQDSSNVQPGRDASQSQDVKMDKWSFLSRPTASSLNKVVQRKPAGVMTRARTRAMAGQEAPVNQAAQASLPPLRAFDTNNLKVEDIDSQDAKNPQMYAPYVNQVYDYMRSLELQPSNCIREGYLKDMLDITPRMRAILVDWLSQVHHRFKLLQETLYLTIYILDRYMQTQAVSRRKLQLVGVTAMFVASKYEEMYAPEIGDFVYITDNAYTEKEILAMELVMLRELDFALGRPLPLHFVRRNSKASYADGERHSLTKYLCEVALPEYETCHWQPSYLAASATCLAMQLLDGDRYTWDDTTAWYSYYSEAQLAPGVAKLAAIVVKQPDSKLKAAYEKFKSSKNNEVSNLPCLRGLEILSIAMRGGKKGPRPCY